MFVLILFTQEKINGYFLLFMITCFITGLVVEIIGTQTGSLFGKYVYNDVLGPEWKDVPLIIGINWFIIIYCCGISIQTLILKLPDPVSITGKPKSAMKAASVIIDGALLAVLFDWIMEPVAVKLGYWTWLESTIPTFNYLTWFIVSALLLAVFHFSPFGKQNKFAVNLLLIQVMFFLVLRTFL